VSSLLGTFSASPLDVAYRLASPHWCYVFIPVDGQPRLSASAHAGAADNP